MGSIPERPFETGTERGPQVISERTRKRREALDKTREARRTFLKDPGVQERSREALEEIARGDEPKNPGLGAEELPDFLREHNS